MARQKKRVRRTTKSSAPVLDDANSPAGAEPDLPEPSSDGHSAPGARSLGFPTVGVGASAGGLDAFKKFLTALPADSGMAFVLVPHLDPHHESLMVELLQKHSPLPIIEATDGLSVEINHVYVIPPNHYLVLRAGVLQLGGPVDRHGLPTAIDCFLRSLAEDQEELAIAIILSGTGCHGVAGIKDVKSRGGLILAQDPATAGYAGMPQSAIATGLVDYVLPPEQMSRALLEYGRQPYVHAGTTAPALECTAEELQQIITLLRGRDRYDFRCYRKPMLLRRIERRMGLNHIDRVSAYIAYLRERPDEQKKLTRDLLISVTQFFRDAEAFAALEAEIARECAERHDPDVPLRVWIPACATGEEAYSVTMLLLEQLAASQKECRVQVFATDVDEEALAVARQGEYSSNIAADVSVERLARFFTRVDEHSYVVCKALREAVTFAPQNVLTTPPFSRMHLIACRNLMIYLEPDVQQRLITLFHFALKERGCLFLGPSETVGRHTDLFEPVSKKWRLYRRLGPTRPDRLSFPIAGSDGQNIRPAFPQESVLPPANNFAQLTERLLLADYSPAAVLIKPGGQILYFNGPTERYLHQSTGKPTHDLFLLAREGLRAKLRTAVQQVVREQVAVAVAAKMRRRGESEAVKVTVKPTPAPKSGEGLLLVVFEHVEGPTLPAAHASDVSEESLVRQLESDLQAARDDLQNTTEEMNSSNEELKAANEESMSMNEELQSANEELQTSKEELQSLNEELTTVNNQLHEKMESLEIVNNDIANLLNSTDIATLFLDIAGLLRRFTPAATRLFHLLPGDVGRPITDFAHDFVDEVFSRDIERVVRDLIPIEREVRSAAGHWYLRRILPYRTADNRIDGVIVTLSDVTMLKQAELALRQDQDLKRLATVLMDSDDAITVQDFDGRITAWNRGAEKMYGYSEAEALHRNILDMMPVAVRERRRVQVEKLRRGERLAAWDCERITKDGRRIDVWVTATLLKDSTGAATAVSTTERDVTERKAAEQEVMRIANEERRRIGQDLHDVTGQELTGLSLMADTLVDALREHASPEVELAIKVDEGIRRVLSQVRAQSRGLVPVEIDAGGLMAALSDLAERIHEQSGAECIFECESPVLLDDNVTATNLFRIAQEAATNALRHGQATSLAISLDRAGDRLALGIRDNGSGFQNSHDKGTDKNAGMGLRIMRYRAGLIGAKFQIEAADGGGTVVTCVLNSQVSGPRHGGNTVH